jgi:regulator of protease activity HflC (stomatin/prohibitin superfamily)
MIAQAGTLLLFIVLFITLIALARSARIVSQYEKGLILRLGRYRATTDSGLTFLVPLIEDMIKVDMRERVINVEPQKVITKDNVSVTVDAVIYYRISDPVKATFEVQNFGYAATTLAQTNLRNLIGDKSLDETLTARDLINTNLRAVLDEATNTWGVKVTRVEVQKIDPPADITEAMSRQMKAERDKRASILESEGVRQSEILRAEGLKQAEILKAEGDAQAIVDLFAPDGVFLMKDRQWAGHDELRALYDGAAENVTPKPYIKHSFSTPFSNWGTQTLPAVNPYFFMAFVK